MVGEASDGGNGSAQAGDGGSFLAEFLTRCPGWKLLIHDMTQPVALVRAERVALVDGTAPLEVVAFQVRQVAEAILNPDEPHPGVVVIEEA